MLDYFSPGVYVKEVSSGVKPIAGVGTSTAAFLGKTERGVPNKAELITNWTQFVNKFGSFISDSYLAYAVYGFFAEGGTSCYVVRVVADGAAPASISVDESNDAKPAKGLFTIQANSVGLWGNKITAEVAKATKNGFKLVVKYDGNVVQTIDNLTIKDMRANGIKSDFITVSFPEPDLRYAKDQNGTLDKGTDKSDTAPATLAKYIIKDKNDNDLFILTAKDEGTKGNGTSVDIKCNTDENNTFTLELKSKEGTYLYKKDNLTTKNIENVINNDPKNKVIEVAYVPVPDPQITTDQNGTLDGGAEATPTTPATPAKLAIKDKGNRDLFILTAKEAGTKDNGKKVDIKCSNDKKTFTLDFQGKDSTSLYKKDNLTAKNIENEINNDPANTFINIALIEIIPKERPAQPLNNGSDGSGALNFLGDESKKTGLHAFDEVDDINILAVPDKNGDSGFILGALAYCEKRRDCFFIADPPKDKSPDDIKAFKNGDSPFNSSYGALYYPWIYISDPMNKFNVNKLVPPSGWVAGIYANVDSTRGVHKAPAGTADGHIRTAVGIERIVTKGENDVLYPEGINLIKRIPEGICLWGGRTLSKDTEWNYINVRRLLLYIEESIDKGSQWVVFEPNDAGLWGKVKRNLTAFLTRVWRDGALFGTTAEEAFFIKVDEENNPPENRDLGQLNIKVGVAPVKPAEFVIIEVSQKILAK